MHWGFSPRRAAARRTTRLIPATFRIARVASIPKSAAHRASRASSWSNAARDGARTASAVNRVATGRAKSVFTVHGVAAVSAAWGSNFPWRAPASPNAALPEAIARRRGTAARGSDVIEAAAPGAALDKTKRVAAVPASSSVATARNAAMDSAESAFLYCSTARTTISVALERCATTASVSADWSSLLAPRIRNAAWVFTAATVAARAAA